MNETFLFILLCAGMVGVAVTIWFAVRFPSPVKSGEVAARGQPQERGRVPGQRELPQQKSLAVRAPAGLALPASAPDTENDAQSVVILLHKAYEQLKTRQQSIESELARIEILRGEHEAVAAQVQALDAVMRVFSLAQAADCRQVDQQRFAPWGNGTSSAGSTDFVHEEITTEA